jgi:RimJ/RimL family protein N-acetyltransferase
MTNDRVQKLKATTLVEALSYAIPVSQDVSLVPVGVWVLDDPKLVNSMCKWRAEHKKSFFAQIEPDADSMISYLSAHSIQNDRNLLFIILATGEPIGHLGFSQISENIAHLDQVMRAIPKDSDSKYKGLMESSIRELANWGAVVLGLEVLRLEVISSNAAAIKLYEKCKFVLQEVIPLKKEITKGGIRLIENEQNKISEVYKHVMQLNLG